MGTSTGVETVLRWAWRYGSLTVDECESVEEAVRDSWNSQDDESFYGVEVIGPDGPRMVPGDEIARLWRAISDEEDARIASASPARWVIRVEGPPDTERWAAVEWVREGTDPAPRLAHWKGLLGDRVMMEEMRR